MTVSTRRLSTTAASSTQVRREGLAGLALKGFSVALAFVTTIVLARTMDTISFGVYSLALALASVCAIPAQLGLPILVVRETARASRENDWSALHALWHWATVVAASLSLLAALFLGATVLGLNSPSTTNISTYLWAGALIPIVTLGNLRGAQLRGVGAIISGQLPEFVLRPAFQVTATIVAYAMLQRALSATEGMALHFIAAAAAFLIGALLLHRRKQALPPTTRGSGAQSRDWWKALWPIALASGAQLLNQHAGLLLLAANGDPADVAIYKVVTQVGALVVVGLMAIELALSPRIARLHQADDSRTLQQLFSQSTLVCCITATPAMLMFVFGGEFALHTVFGPAFATGSTAASVIVIARFICACFGPQVALLNMTGHEDAALISVVIALVANVLLSLLLIPTWGLVGAALASAIGLLMWALSLRRFALRRLRIETWLFSPKGVKTLRAESTSDAAQ